MEFANILSAAPQVRWLQPEKKDNRKLHAPGYPLIFRYNTVTAKTVKQKIYAVNGQNLVLCEEILDFLSLDKLLLEDIGSSLGRPVHTDALHHTLSTGLGAEGCDRFLCHKSIPPYLISR